MSVYSVSMWEDLAPCQCTVSPCGRTSLRVSVVQCLHVGGPRPVSVYSGVACGRENVSLGLWSDMPYWAAESILDCHVLNPLLIARTCSPNGVRVGEKKFSVFKLIGVLFLPTTTWLHKLYHQLRWRFASLAEVSHDVCPGELRLAQQSKRRHLMEKFVKPIFVGRKRAEINMKNRHLFSPSLPHPSPSLPQPSLPLFPIPPLPSPSCPTLLYSSPLRSLVASVVT